VKAMSMDVQVSWEAGCRERPIAGSAEPIGDGMSFNAACFPYAENELPQPQVVFAFGLRIENCAPCRLSL